MTLIVGQQEGHLFCKKSAPIILKVKGFLVRDQDQLWSKAAFTPDQVPRAVARRRALSLCRVAASDPV